MRFALAIETSVGLEHKVDLLVELSARLSEYFSMRDYGEDLLEIIIRVISVAPEFEWFSKVRKPKFTHFKRYINSDGIEIVEDRLFTFETKIDYERFKNQSEEENREMLAAAIESSLSSFDSLPRRIKQFDKDLFGSDLRAFLSEWCRA